MHNNYLFSVSIIQKKWRSIRTCYSRELLKKKSLKSGSGSSHRKQYIYFEQLQFLETISKKTSNSIDPEESDEGNDVQERADPDDPQSFASDNVYCVQSGVRPKTTKRVRGRNSDDILIEALKKKVVDEETDNTDEDRHFLLSLISDMKKVPSENKLLLRSNIISAIATAQQHSVQQNWQPFPQNPPLTNIPYYNQNKQFPSQLNYVSHQNFRHHQLTQPNFFPPTNHNAMEQECPRQFYNNLPSSSCVQSLGPQPNFFPANNQNINRHNKYEQSPITTPTPTPPASGNSNSEESEILMFENSNSQ
uniref:BESS domain-containing protein n=1 Tax=Clastoptera arizonana TaxID=38151 RepID=A0A1B6E4U5_9HEMI